jgi:hypothetical protein
MRDASLSTPGTHSVATGGGISRTIGSVQHNGDLSVAFHQATGMVSVQADCRVEAAVVLIERRAAADGISVEQVAQDVIDRQTHFRPGG